MSETPLPGILLTLLLCCSAATGLLSVHQTDHVTGWDGYYYLVQISSFSETGEMHSPEFSAVYLPMLFFHRITGDYMAAYRFSAVFIKLLFVLSVFCLSLAFLKPGENAWAASVAIASLSAASPSLNFFFTQFPKNLMGFAFLFLFMASLTLLKRSEPVKPLKLIILPVILFLLTFFTHRFSAVLALLYLLITGILHLGRIRFRILYLLIPVPVLAAAIIAHNLSLAPSLHDLERVTGDLSLKPILVPVAFLERFGAEKTTLLWKGELILAGIVSLTGIFFLKAQKVSREYAAVAVLIPLGLFPFLEFSLTGLSYRLFFWTLLAAPLVFLPWAAKTGEKTLSIIAAVMCCVSFISFRTYEPELHDPPYHLYGEISERCTERLSERNCQLIIAHRSLAEVITFSTEFDALPWSPEQRFPREEVWRITAGILHDDVSLHLGPESADQYFDRLYGDYGLLREDKWEEFLDAIADDPELVSAVNTWRNPMELRPSYLQKNR